MAAGGHTSTEVAKRLSSVSVASGTAFVFVLILAALNDLEVKAADIQNAYLTASVSEKIWTRLGLNFQSDSAKIATLVRAL